MKQYRGGHNETWGGVTINIDSNWLDLGTGSRRRAGAGALRRRAAELPHATRSSATGATGAQVTRRAVPAAAARGLQRHDHRGDRRRARCDAVRAWRADHGLPAGRGRRRRRLDRPCTPTATRRLIKYGAAGERVRRLQRALNAAGPERPLGVTGRASTADDRPPRCKRYQRPRRHAADRRRHPGLWDKLVRGTTCASRCTR